MAKTTKIPKRFRKQLKQRSFEKKILRRVHLPKERAFLERVFESSPGGTRHLADSLSDEDRRHLAQLHKDIRKNRGSLRSMRLIALLILVGAPIVFNVLFLDSILQRALERGLQTAFSARSDVTGLDLAPLAGTVTIDRITVGDRRRPMTNLFELEALSADLNMAELLKKNLVVHDASIATVRTRTARQTSAELPRSENVTAQDASGGDGQSLLDRARDAGTATFEGAGSLADPQALVDREISNLQTPERLDEISENLSRYAEQWSTRLDSLEERSEEVLETAERIRAIDPEELNTPGRIAETVELARSSRERVGKLLDTAEEIADSTETQYRELQSAVSSLQGALEADFEYLASQFSLSSVEISEFTVGLAERFLTEFLGEVYTTGERAINIARRLKRMQSQQASEPGLARDPGREVPFPSVSYPRFFLERAGLAVEPGERQLRLEGRLSSVSSDPALTGAPTRLSLAGTAAGVSLGLESELGYEQNGDPANLLTTVSGSGFSFESPRFSQFGRFSSTYLFDTTMDISRSEATRSVTSVELNDLDFQPIPSENPVITAVQEVFTGINTIDLNAVFTVSDRRLNLEEFDTSVDDALRSGIRNRLAQRRDEYIARAKDELQQRIEARRAEVQPLLDRAAELQQTAEQLERTLENNREMIARKRAELERRAESLVQQQRERLEDEAQEQREKLEDDARDRLDEATEDLDLDGLGF